LLRLERSLQLLQKDGHTVAELRLRRGALGPLRDLGFAALDQFVSVVR